MTSEYNTIPDWYSRLPRVLVMRTGLGAEVPWVFQAVR